jgi:hypothetical protein
MSSNEITFVIIICVLIGFFGGATLVYKTSPEIRYVGTEKVCIDTADVIYTRNTTIDSAIMKDIESKRNKN